MSRLVIQVRENDIMLHCSSVVHMHVEYRVKFWSSHFKMNSTELNKGMKQLPWNLIIPRHGIFLEYHILISVDDLLARLLNSSGDK